MLEFNLLEKSILLLLTALATYSAVRTFKILRKTMLRGRNNYRKITFRHALDVLVKKVVLLLPTWKTRFWPGLFHLSIVWGFLLFLLINMYELINRLFPQTELPLWISSVLLPTTDILSGLIICGVVFFSIRRLLFGKDLIIRKDIPLMPDVRKKINRDSAIVLALIFIHISSRILADSLKAVYIPNTLWLPITNSLTRLWMPSPFLIFFWKIFSWSTLLSLFAFIPYFPYSKHFHLIMAPFNFLLKEKSTILSTLQPINFEDESLSTFGAIRLEEMRSSSILDAYACIMCSRCQNVCPPYNSGSELSPAAYEINKRIYLNQNYAVFSQDTFESLPLTDYAISEKAVWDCTACGACVEICPVGNDPMKDILEMRRHLILMEDTYPKSFQVLFRNMERYSNPWGISNAHRLDWAAGKDIPTIEKNPNPDVLWWVGCAGAFDSLAQTSSLAFLEILNTAKINFAVLGHLENCSGDSARRAGKEDLFFELAQHNVETLNQISPRRIVTGCAHCFHALKNEYPAFGGNYQVIHSSEFLAELMEAGSIRFQPQPAAENVSFHDPCYLSRINDSGEAAYSILEKSGDSLLKQAYRHTSTWCCGAGGTQIWKESSTSGNAINQTRFNQLTDPTTQKLITACPFCKTMLTDANQKADAKIKVQDLSEYMLEKMIRENE